MNEELTAEHVIAAGGWHPGYARVLAIATDGDLALAIVDGNGDGQELEAEIWVSDQTGWAPIVSWGAGPLDLGRPAHDLAHGWSRGAHYAHGVAPDHQTVTITFNGEVHTVEVTPSGVWAFIRAGRAAVPPPTRTA